ncbi:hypothetical protein B9Q00_11075 [Candidatus Marsarchaeota G1 archaeon OSP_C]|uniref:CRISPR type III-associated protein domain-containing protein n=1 Tax=Candidatus Marsarchaeota G1 archaeon OSP_C TaxID=1978154 RepID=A0A2R6AG71_9ARCH|nr:MAG: hypothetical protein B9Q00_11075 [Candidatus Marsarchaeota G1 archaeon OSP_C]
MKIKFEYQIILKTSGMWGSGFRTFEANSLTAWSIVDQPKNDKSVAEKIKVPCIPATYIKGLLRKSMESIEWLLKKANVIDQLPGKKITDEILGMRGDPLPSKVVITKAIACDNQLFEKYESKTFLEPHVRISDSRLAAGEGTLFRELRIKPNTKFYGEIVAYPPDGRESSWIYAILLSLLNFNNMDIGKSQTFGIVKVTKYEGVPQNIEQKIKELINL